MKRDRLDPNKYYIDSRIGVNPSDPKDSYLGKYWIGSGFEPEFMREVVINEHGYFVEVGND